MINPSALVYFTSFYSDRSTERVFPVSPEEILDNGCSLCLHIPSEEAIGKTDTSFNECWTFSSSSSLVSSSMEAIHTAAQRGVQVFYSVHPKATVIPLVRWHLMHPYDVDGKGVDAEITRLSHRFVDLCEAFHKPAILPLETRYNFGPEVINRWLLHRPAEEVDDYTALESLRIRLP